VINLTTFTLAMIKLPEAQRRAQEEIDRVVCSDRPPSFPDRENLPHVAAMVKEAIRWWPISPMGFPHAVTGVFECKGCCIPKGEPLLPAIWSFLHDPSLYPEPELFDPKRFLPPKNEPDVEAFGYGRKNGVPVASSRIPVST
jgi:cytochrome P450